MLGRPRDRTMPIHTLQEDRGGLFQGKRYGDLTRDFASILHVSIMGEFLQTKLSDGKHSTLLTHSCLARTMDSLRALRFKRAEKLPAV